MMTNQDRSVERGLEVFISYSHEDERYRKQLEKHLALLQHEGVIQTWQDRKISPGTEWAGQIDAHLDTADIILLMVSPDFIASHYCWDVEVKRAVERHEAGKARVIPIVVRPADWHTAPFSKLQALPKDGKAVTTWQNRDQAWLSVVEGLRRAAKEPRAGTLAAGAEPSESHASLPPSRPVQPRAPDELPPRTIDSEPASVEPAPPEEEAEPPDRRSPFFGWLKLNAKTLVVLCAMTAAVLAILGTRMLWPLNGEGGRAASATNPPLTTSIATVRPTELVASRPSVALAETVDAGLVAPATPVGTDILVPTAQVAPVDTESAIRATPERTSLSAGSTPVPAATGADSTVPAPVGTDQSQQTGRLLVRLPKDAPALYPVVIGGSATLQQIGLSASSAPLELEPGVYTVTLPSPFLGVRLENIVVNSGQAIFVDVAQEVGRLGLILPDSPPPETVSITSETGASYELRDDRRSGPIWLPPGKYSLELGAPYIGVEQDNVTLESGKAITVTMAQDLGMLALRVPEFVSSIDFSVYDQQTGTFLGTGSGTGPFGLSPGSYRIHTWSQLVLVNRDDIVVQSGKTITVDLVTGLGKLSFMVPEGIALHGVKISRELESSSTGRTGPFWLPAGRYDIELGAPFIAVKFENVDVESGKEMVVKVTTQGLGQLALQLPPDVQLKAIDVYDQQGQKVGSSDGGGPFWLPPGQYTVNPGPPFVAVGVKDVVIKSGDVFTMSLPTQLGRVSLRLPENVSLNAWVRITDQATGKELDSSSYSTQWFMPQGTYAVTFPSPFIGLRRNDITVAAGETTTVDVSQQVGKLVLVAPPDVSLDGIAVADQETGKPVGSASGSGPFWLLPGTYVITPTLPLTGVYRDVVVSVGSVATVPLR